jgi:hypothetical protein
LVTPLGDKSQASCRRAKLASTGMGTYSAINCPSFD